jgi:hypothetical protein
MARWIDMGPAQRARIEKAENAKRDAELRANAGELWADLLRRIALNANRRFAGEISQRMYQRRREGMMAEFDALRAKCSEVGATVPSAAEMRAELSR